MNTETEALLAVLRGDDEAAERLVRSMTGTERRDLARGLERLDGLVYRIRREKDMEPPPQIHDPALWTS